MRKITLGLILCSMVTLCFAGQRPLMENDQRNNRSQQQIKHTNDQNRNQCNVQSKEPHGGAIQCAL